MSFASPAPASASPWSQPVTGGPQAPIPNSFPNANSANGPLMNNLNSNFQTGFNAPATPFPTLGGNNYYPTPPYNPFAQNPAQAVQNEVNQRRLGMLEDENAQRRNATMTMQQMGKQLLQDQMEVQEQILQYQFMLEQCMETLDHQNFILNEQSEELALLRAKIRQFESFMENIKQFREASQNGQIFSPESNILAGNHLCSRNLLTLQSSSINSPFYPAGIVRSTSSTFQPFNPRYRSPTKQLSRPLSIPNN